MQLLEEKEKELCEKEKRTSVCCTSIFCNVIFCYDEQELTAEFYPISQFYPKLVLVVSLIYYELIGLLIGYQHDFNLL